GLRARQFDAAIIFTSFRQSPLPAAYLAYLADIPLRLAASIDGPGSLLTTRHKHPEHMMHEVERGLDLVAAVGLATDNLDLALRVPDEARRSLAERLPLADLPRPLVVVHPGCSMPARTYPWEMFAASADLLAERLGATIVLTGVADERPLTERIAARMTRPALSVAGDLSFPEFAALIEAADLTITNNTGPMHISAAVKTPVVALFALTNPPPQWGPWRVPHRQLYHEVACRLCYSRVCPTDHACLRQVTPEMVAEASVELLAATTPQGRRLADAAISALAQPHMVREGAS
ncbi:MAG: glycosyltransferase family 9 protein, partial [Anaerolineae bacterium]